MSTGQIFKKLTKEPKNKLWTKIKKVLSIVPLRSSGIVINETYRNPPPGSRPEKYQEALTIPAGDVADNPFWKRDTRRNYPKTSVISQQKLCALLTCGSAEMPLLDAKTESTDLAKIESLKLVDVILSKDLNDQILDSKGLAPIPGKPYSWKHYPDSAFKEEYPVRALA